MLRFKAPLSWPDSIPITAKAAQRADHGFSPNITLSEGIRFLDEELKAMDVSDSIIYLDVDQPLVERLSKKVGTRSGACLHFTYRGRGYMITCDRWQKIEHNVYALHLPLRQFRNMERWGVGLMSHLLAGFEADRVADTQDTTEGASEAFKIFGLGPTATLDDATAIYHRRAKTYAHEQDQLSRLNIAMDELRNYFGNK